MKWWIKNSEQSVDVSENDLRDRIIEDLQKSGFGSELVAVKA